MRLTLPTDRMILEELKNGRNVAVNIAAEIDRSPGFLNRRLPELEGHYLVRSVGPADDTGLYELTSRGEAVLRLVDDYSREREFERRVDDLAETIEVRQCCIVDVDPETESGATECVE